MIAVFYQRHLNVARPERRLQPLRDGEEELIADEVAAVEVLALGSSKGGSGTARPPKRPFASRSC